MDAGYKTPWIAKRSIDDGIVPVLPYTRYKGAKDSYRPWEYTYIPEKDVYLCPQGKELRHTTTDKDGKRSYRSTPKNCRDCPYQAKCMYAMRYTHHRGLTAATRWVKLKFAAMNLKRLAVWSWKNSFLSLLFPLPFQVFHKTHQNPCLAAC